MTTNAQREDADIEVGDITVDVSAIRRVRGRGNIVYECVALVEIGGIPITIYGITLRNDRPREVGVYLPQYRGADGAWRPSIEFPAAVERALATAALEQVQGGVVVSNPIKERVRHD